MCCSWCIPEPMLGRRYSQHLNDLDCVFSNLGFCLAGCLASVLVPIVWVVMLAKAEDLAALFA